MVLRCVVFDFDGTLVDTNSLKRDAYVTVLGRIGVPAALCAEELRGYPHEDRYGVIQQILARWRQAPPSADEVLRFADEYGAICESGAVHRPEIPGAVSALHDLAGSHRLFINSATPEESLQRIVERRGWSAYFTAVLGRPREKVENLRLIMEREHASGEEVVMVGDSIVDRTAADAAGCRFVAVVDFPRDALRPGELLVADLQALPDVLGRIFSAR